MAEVILVDVGYVKRYTPLNVSVEDYNVSVTSVHAQIKNIKPYLGDELYAKIIELVATGDISLPQNSAYKVLLDNYVRMALSWWVIVEMMPILRVKISNGGLLQRTPAETTPGSQVEVDSVANMARQNAHHYTWELIRFLKRNKSDYPEYRCAESKVMGVAGFEIGMRRGKSWNQ